MTLRDPKQQKEYATYCRTSTRKKYPIIFAFVLFLSILNTLVYVRHLRTGEPLVEGDDIETMLIQAIICWELFGILLLTYLFSKRFLWILDLTTPCVALIPGSTCVAASLYYVPKDSE